MWWGQGRRCKALAKRFVEAINAHDVDAMAALVTDDFVYIDSWREGIRGREIAMQAAGAMFAADPAFRMDVEAMSFADPHVLMRGWIESANPDIDRVRAVWRCRCEDGKFAEWQSWAQSPVPKLLRQYAAGSTEDLSSRAPEQPETR